MTRSEYGRIVLTQYDMGGRSWVDFLGDLFKGNIKDSHISARYTIRDAFPINVSGLSFDHEGDAQLQTYDVTFQYLYMDRGTDYGVDGRDVGLGERV